MEPNDSAKGFALKKLMAFVLVGPLLVSSASFAASDFDIWIQKQSDFSEIKLFENVSAPGTAQGSVVASPSKIDPNYYFYWVRDGSLTMDSVLGLYKDTSGAGRSALLSRLDDFRVFTQRNQNTPTWPGLGDPRYNADGSADNLPWGRPQNDGPALRALMFTRFAQSLLTEGRRDYVDKYLYAPVLPAGSVIKADLEYVAHNWSSKCFDLWEEIYGQHFFTRAVQYASLVEGADLAESQGDPQAANFYRQTSQTISRALEGHWSDQKGYYLATVDSEAGPDHQKTSQLDTAVILAVLASDREEGVLSPLSDKILSTALAIENSFASVYQINSDKSVGTAIGRYAEDYYYGGNPWFLTTSGFAQLHYRVARLLKSRNSYFLTPLSVAFFASTLPESERSKLSAGMDVLAEPNMKAQLLQALITKGDGFLKRVQKHMDAAGNMSEQYRRDSGLMLSANDLTWSYAAFIEAGLERKQAQ
jgi:glucoamylase